VAPPHERAADGQLWELATTINVADCDIVVTGTPIDLGRLIQSRHPIRHVRYELDEVGKPTIRDVLEPIVAQARTTQRETVALR
jgi:predicted GTPase